MCTEQTSEHLEQRSKDQHYYMLDYFAEIVLAMSSDEEVPQVAL